LTLGQTNSKFSKGQPPANQCYVATHAGFSVYYTTDNDPSTAQTITLPAGADLYAILQNFSWDLQIGRGITRTIGTLLEYPSAGGAWASAAGDASAQNGDPSAWTTKLPIPIIFPPLVNVTLTAKNGNSFVLAGVADNGYIVVRLNFRGFLMTMPVGG
jgi:hypothetical protein